MGPAVPMMKGYSKELIRVNPRPKGMAMATPDNHSTGQSGNFLDQRRQARMCFECGDRYYSGHQCKRQLLLLEGEGGIMEEEEIMEAEELEGEDNGEISLQALKGTNNKIIKVEGKVQEGSLMILINSRSSHSFLHESTAKRLHCRLTGT